MGRIAQPVLGNVQSVLSRYLSTTPNRPFSLPSEHAAQYRVPRPLTCIPSSFISPRRMLPNVGPGQLGLGLVEPRCFMYHHITCLVFKSLPPSTRQDPRPDALLSSSACWRLYCPAAHPHPPPPYHVLSPWRGIMHVKLFRAVKQKCLLAYGIAIKSDRPE
jgi:hypothetical protein